jgi:uncharacterized protein (DUF885 family)
MRSLRLSLLPLPFLVLAVSVSAQSPADKAWIARSNTFTQRLIDIDSRYLPEEASAQGLSKFDTKIADPSLASVRDRRKEEEAVVQKLIAARKEEKDPNVAEDLDILIAAEQRAFRQQDFALNSTVEYINATSFIYRGIASLLDDQVAQNRRISATERLKRYAGIDPDPAANRGAEMPNMGRNAAANTGLTNSMYGDNSLVSILIRRTTEQMNKPNMVYPSQIEIESQLARNIAMNNGMQALFVKYKLPNWEPTFAVIQRELVFYDDWVRKNLLPRARTDFRLPPQQYALALAGYGIDIPPAQLAETAHKAFDDYQGQMKTLAAEIAKEHGWASSDYRDVIRELKKQQLTGDAILPFYEKRLKEIETIIKDKGLVTLPERPAIIRIATPAETAEQPAPHMVPPPFLHNTGQRGVFVLPLSSPAVTGQAQFVKTDDFTFDAASWTLIAHEARPGHELQFDSMVEHGVSTARALYAFNSANVEGWGLYAESILLPYMPKEGQLISLQFRLQRAARAFLDPELQSGKIQTADAMRTLTADVVLSSPFAVQEVERYTSRAPGQANSYFYGFTRLLALRKETEEALGSKFDALRFHDFVLAQGILPPDLMQQAVEKTFIPMEKAR